MREDALILWFREESAGGTGRSLLARHALTRDAPILPKREEFVSGMVQRQRNARHAVMRGATTS